MKSLLLLGGTGFFGASFIHAFYKGNLEKWGIGELLIVSRNASSFPQHNPACHGLNIHYIDLDISKLSALPKCDYIMHFAGSSDKARYEKNLSEELRNIDQNMILFVKSIEEASANPSHVLYASSGAVYGPTDAQKFSEEDKVDNVDAFHSVKQYYAQSKLISENTFRQLAKKNRKLSIARCFSFVGPCLPLDTHFVAGNLIRNILNKEALKIKAQIPVMRSYLHTDDLVEWLMEVMLNGTYTGSIFNVGSDDDVEIHDLAKDLASHFDLPLDATTPLNHDADFYVPNIRKARSIGLQPRYSSLQAIIKTVDDIKQKSSRHGI